MKLKIVTIFCGLSMLLYNCKGEVDNTMKLITVEEMQTLSKRNGVQLVDIRTPSEFSEGYIINAQNMDYWSPDFDKRIETLDKSKPIIIYCKSGGRSAKCAVQLKDKGFVEIYDLKGGISEWKLQGMPIEK